MTQGVSRHFVILSGREPREIGEMVPIGPRAELLEQLATCVGREALMSHAAMKSATHKSRLEEALRARGA